MATEAILGAFVTVAVEQLIEKIVSREFADFFQSKKLDVALLEKLNITLLSLQAVLNDAEEKQITNPAVKEWLQMLGDAVFEADNLLDEINTKALQHKVKAQFQSQTATTKVRNILSLTFKRPYGEINSKMRKLLETLEHFSQKGHLLGLTGVSSGVWHGTPASSVVDESAIYGRDDDKQKLKDCLLSQDASDSGSKIGVIAICGMGGLGKTTLANLLYNDPEVKDKFDLKGWAHISKDFDVCRLTKILLESVTSKTTDTNNLNTLQVELQQSLSNKRFLLVLDDIWDGTNVEWNNLQVIFNAGKKGSRIIITTRDEGAACAIQPFLLVHHLEKLQIDDCWSLLAKHAFGESKEKFHLEAIGKEIARKCDGLPLAAVALGRLLRTKLSHDHWNKVLKSNIWDLKDVGVQPALLLSYHHLPGHLKGCFAYCSVFQKNSELDKEMVVQLWMAEGLVRQSKIERSIEEEGGEYFDELVSRSLIHRRSVDGEDSFEMHDLINDLATMVSSAYCIRLDEKKPHKSIRHLSYNRKEYDTFDTFGSLQGLKGLRTFLALPLTPEWWEDEYYLSNEVIYDLLPEMKQLRALSLSCYKNITKLPDSIGNLIYLRYLNLSGTEIESLPSTICKMYNLQTLLLSRCYSLAVLPEDIEKLVNLRHLDISETGLREVPIQIATLENLQTLSDFVVSKGQDGMKVAELRKFPHLRGKLVISSLQNVTNPSDAGQANLKMKERIDELELNWDYSDNATINDSKIDRLVLEHLEPSKKLKKLSIKEYGGESFPNWLGDYSLNMVYLSISDCDNCSLLPPLGQLGSLKELYIYKMRSVKSVGAEFYGSSSNSSPSSFQPFPSLERLVFVDMPEWEEWEMIGGKEFPSLRYLYIWDCPKLKGNLPRNLPSLTELVLCECPLLLESGRYSDGNSSSNNNNIKKSSSDHVFRQLMQPLPFLTKLTLSGFPSLTSFPREGLPKTLQSLFIQQCPNLEFLPHEYTSLEDLTIFDSCYSMTSFALGSFPVLKSLHLKGCKNLKSVSTATQNGSLSFLLSITICGCGELESLCPGGFPKTLQTLFIQQCPNLEFLPHEYTSLEDLTIFDSCDSMTSFALGSLPVLESLHLKGCKNLKSVFTATQNGSLLFLQSITICGCGELESFWQGGFLSTPNLIRLDVRECEKLESLLESIHTLTGLQELSIENLPNLNSSFAREGLPVNLRKLHVRGNGGWNTDAVAINALGLQRLNCLSELQLSKCDDMVKALMKTQVPLLPTSLVSLDIRDLQDIKCLDGRWLQHLTSLQKLEIALCPNLESLPKEGFPSSLLALRIQYCPLLEASCLSKLGKERRKIARSIPFIFINDYQVTI